MALRSLMQQAREAGASRLKQVEEMKRNDPQGFSLMLAEHRTKRLGQPGLLCPRLCV